MQTDFWHARWQQNNIGFHKQEINSYLLEHWQTLAVAPPATVFVPLCGKSVDISWFLQQGYQVEAVELSSIAIEAMLGEQALNASVTRQDDFEVWSGEGFRIWCGDYFALTAAQLGRIDAVYDRAALIALPKPMRVAYVKHMKQLVGTAPYFLITLSYVQAEMDGPPFSVTGAEVESLYGKDYQGVNKPLVSSDVLTRHARFFERGLSYLQEHVYLMQVAKK
jgi:thiopurine S-methyltransferase